jgi:hypothetical protein
MADSSGVEPLLLMVVDALAAQPSLLLDRLEHKELSGLPLDIIVLLCSRLASHNQWTPVRLELLFSPLPLSNHLFFIRIRV